MSSTPKRLARARLHNVALGGLTYNHLSPTLTRYVRRTMEHMGDRLTTVELERLADAIQHIRVAVIKKASGI